MIFNDLIIIQRNLEAALNLGVITRNDTQHGLQLLSAIKGRSSPILTRHTHPVTQCHTKLQLI